MKAVSKTEDIIIVSCCNNNYIPYLSVLIKSINKNVSDRYSYEIIIVEFEVSESNKMKVLSMHLNKNVKVKFLHVEDELINRKSRKWSFGRWSKELFITILAPYLLPEYEKAIYMDCDVINMADLCDLYSVDLGDNLVAASRVLGRCIMEDPSFLTEQVLAYQKDSMIDQLSGYFNNGIMLLNLKAFRDTYTLKELLGIVEKQKFPLLDQDCINFLCKGRVLYVDAGWNWYPYTKTEFDNVITLCPVEYKSYFQVGYFNTKNIHYTIPVKPWLEPLGYYFQASSLFWESAVDTPFYSQIVDKLVEYQRNKQVLAEYEKRKISDIEKKCCDIKLYLYGLGKRGEEWINKKGYVFDGIIDENRLKWGVYQNIPVWGLQQFQEVANDKAKSMILISNEKYRDIVLTLWNMGFTNMFILKNNSDEVLDIPWEKFGEISIAKSLWSDLKSKIIFAEIVKRRMLQIGDKSIKCADLYEGNMYYRSDLLPILEGMTVCFVDSLKSALLKQDFVNWAKHRNISCVSDIYSEIETIYYLFRFDGEHAIDEIGRNMKVIERHKCCLFIDIKAGGSNLWELPIYIHQKLGGYDLFIRHHRTSIEGSVLYAIPKEITS